MRGDKRLPKVTRYIVETWSPAQPELGSVSSHETLAEAMATAKRVLGTIWRDYGDHREKVILDKKKG